MLELAFATRELRTQCEDEIHAAAALGTKIAKVLKHRLADLRAADHPLDLPFAPKRIGIGNLEAHVQVDLVDGFYLEFKANHPRLPRSPDGSIAWDRVSRVQILRIEPGFE